MIAIEMISGGIGSGKAYITYNHLKKYKETGHSVFLISFADIIKEMIGKMFNVDKYGNTIINDWKEKSEDECINILFSYISEYVRFCKNRDYLRSCFKDIKDYHAKFIDKEIDGKEFARYAMQILGTEIGQSIKKTLWVEIVIDTLEKLNKLRTVDYVIIDDWRFLFEFSYMYSEFCQLNNVELRPFYVDASEEVRAKRRNISIENLREMSNHISEKESKNVILPYMNLYYPENIIINEGD